MKYVEPCGLCGFDIPETTEEHYDTTLGRLCRDCYEEMGKPLLCSICKKELAFTQGIMMNGSGLQYHLACKNGQS